MNRLLINILLLLSLHGCQVENDKKEEIKPIENSIDSIELNAQEEPPSDFDTAKHLKNYQRLKSSIKKHQEKIRTNNDLEEEAKFKLAENYMSKILIDSIFQYWIGTTWDFNGYTEKPREGEIACGYFVSTTLRDLGIKLNRFKVAQKGASDIIHELCDQGSIEKISSLEKLIEFLKNIKEEEVLIVGLDFHVGFIFKKENKSYFAHSNYINRKGVEIELLQDSDALRNSNIYVVGNLTRNKNITRNWLN